MSKKLHPETLTATALGWIDRETDAMAFPLRPSTSFLRDPKNLDRAGRMFTRDDNPTFEQPEALINRLEGFVKPFCQGHKLSFELCECLCLLRFKMCFST